jgi:hypothetical protein
MSPTNVYDMKGSCHACRLVSALSRIPLPFHPHLHPCPLLGSNSTDGSPQLRIGFPHVQSLFQWRRKTSGQYPPRRAAAAASRTHLERERAERERREVEREGERERRESGEREKERKNERESGER